MKNKKEKNINMVNMNKANKLLKLGQLKEAEEIIIKAYNNTRNFNTQKEAWIHNLIGLTYVMILTAREHNKKALEICNKQIRLANGIQCEYNLINLTAWKILILSQIDINFKFPPDIYEPTNYEDPIIGVNKMYNCFKFIMLYERGIIMDEEYFYENMLWQNDNLKLTSIVTYLLYNEPCKEFKEYLLKELRLLLYFNKEKGMYIKHYYLEDLYNKKPELFKDETLKEITRYWIENICKPYREQLYKK